MEARKDTDVNIKVNQRGLVPVSSPRRAERAPGSEPTATRWRNLERAQGSAAELSHSGGVSTVCGELRAGSDGGEGGRFTGCSLGRQSALIPAGLRVWRHPDGDGSPWVGSGARGFGCGLAPWEWEQHWRGRRVCYIRCWRDRGGLETSELMKRKRASHRGKCGVFYKLIYLDGKEACEGFCMRT